MKAHEHVILEIARERERQMGAEGWTHEHDDTHDNGEMARAAACYALGQYSLSKSAEAGDVRVSMSFHLWPWSSEWWRPKGTRKNLVRAAALLVAEIERLDRAAADLKRTG